MNTQAQSFFFRISFSLILAALSLSGIASANPKEIASSPPLSSNNSRENIAVAAQSGQFHTPTDSTPSPDAATIYFTAVGPNGAGVFGVPSHGGPVESIAAGHPFVLPSRLVVSTDGQVIYVADPLAWSGDGHPGQIFVVAVGGHTAMPLRGTAGSSPRGLDVVSEGGRDVIYFTGNDPSNGQPTVFKIAASGNHSPTIISEGAPLVEPDGVAVARSGVVYVSDGSSSGPGKGSIFKINGPRISTITDDARLGDPAGIALTFDETSLLVSAIQKRNGHDEVLVIDLATLETDSITRVVGENVKAGGLHRARFGNVFSWCGISSTGVGTVYRIGL